ncbi:MAG TPA: family 16 glycosylhydrolase, partial [Halanaerobiales bacterium]|nr:family 16 glycosylhydrolase [Halanaerobiales bacterium]
GYPDESTEFPQRMEVDYIRVYDLEGDLQWGDEFNNIDTDIWTFEVGNGHANGIPGWGNAESQYYTDGDNAEIEGGKLVIEAREEERSDSYGNYEYTSSRMITRDAVMMKYGRVEIRAKLPEGQGIWPAIWMLGTDGGWPDCGEIDIMELVGHQPDTVHGTVHGPGYSGGNGIGSSYQLSDGKFSDDFHTFILEWDEDEIRWFVDDELEPFHTIWMDADGYVDYDDKPDELDITEGEVVNGTFDDPIVDDQDGSPDNWFVWYGEGGYVTDYGVEDGEFKIEIAQLGNETWAVQFNQFIKLTEGNYELSFEARAEDERGINIMVQEDGGGWAVFGEENIDITTDMQEYSIDVSLSYTETPKLSFSLGNTPNGVPTTVYIDNVSIEKVD